MIVGWRERPLVDQRTCGSIRLRSHLLHFHFYYNPLLFALF